AGRLGRSGRRPFVAGRTVDAVRLQDQAARGRPQVGQGQAEVGAGAGEQTGPWPTTTGWTSRTSSSTRPCASSVRIRVPLPQTCSSPPGSALSARTASGTSPDRTVVPGQSGSVRVVETTYLGRPSSAWPTGLPGSMPAPQEAAKI